VAEGSIMREHFIGIAFTLILAIVSFIFLAELSGWWLGVK